MKAIHSCTSIFVRCCLLLLALIYSARCPAQSQTGKASFYADRFEGLPTASGEKYKHNKLTAAHRTLPFGTKVRVTNITNKKQVEVVINDRGPYADGRIIDLSRSAAEALGFVPQGLTEVTVEVLDAGDGMHTLPTKPTDAVPAEEKEFYSMDVQRLRPGGYGVQIGTYQELINLMRLADNLKSSYKKKITVQVKNVNGVKYYGLILGTFSSRQKADKFKASIQGKYPDAFIAEFDRMR